MVNDLVDLIRFQTLYSINDLLIFKLQRDLDEVSSGLARMSKDTKQDLKYYYTATTGKTGMYNPLDLMQENAPSDVIPPYATKLTWACLYDYLYYTITRTK